MRRFVVFTLAALLTGWVVSAAGPAHQYIGVKGCSMCHKSDKQGKQSVIWQASEHAKAFQVLKTPEAAAAAAKAGVKKPAHEASECLKCHVTGHGLPADQFKPTFLAEDGVQCEACHGPGSDYKTMAVMKDRAKAIAGGMTPIAVKDGSAEKQCKTCHNQHSPTFEGFDFKTAWAKIAHPKPAQ